jgi:hypothetical protein
LQTEKHTPGFNVDLFVALINFEKSNVLDPERAKNRLIDEISWPHILRNRISTITYQHNPCPDNDGNIVIRGYFCPPKMSMEPGEAIIFQQPPNITSEQSVEYMYYDIYHEIGHSVYLRLRNSSKEIWLSITEMDNADLPNRTIFGKKLSPDEEFAGSFGHYIQQPALLADINENKYDFLKHHIFFGKEYPDRFSKEAKNGY